MPPAPLAGEALPRTLQPDSTLEFTIPTVLDSSKTFTACFQRRELSGDPFLMTLEDVQAVDLDDYEGAVQEAYGIQHVLWRMAEDPKVDDALRTTACILSLWVGTQCLRYSDIQRQNGQWVLRFAKACLGRYRLSPAVVDYSVDLEDDYEAAAYYLEDVQQELPDVTWRLTEVFGTLDPVHRKL